MQIAVVTGVSTGIGCGITKVLIQQGFRVFGSVRKTQDAERLTREFGIQVKMPMSSKSKQNLRQNMVS